MSSVILLLFITSSLIISFIKKQNPFELYLDGCKDGLNVFKSIFTNLLAMMLTITFLRYSGLLEAIEGVFREIFDYIGLQVQLIPLFLIKPFSGSGGLAVLNDLYYNYGVDSPVSFIATIIQSSSDTMFYIFALYFGVTSVKNYRYALKYAWIGVISSFVLAIIAAKTFF